MPRRLDWEKAHARDVARESKQPPKSSVRRRATAQDARAAFVKEHNIACFKCGATTAEWAKTGISKRGAWAICTSCVGES